VITFTLAGDHERGVEAHAELADDVDVIALRGLFGLLELQAVGMGDGAQVLLQLVGVHADAVVGHRDGAGVLVEETRIFSSSLPSWICGRQALEVQLVLGVGRVRDQLAQEDLAVRVDGVDHQVEQLLALRLEFPHRGRHPFPSSRAALCRRAARVCAAGMSDCAFSGRREACNALLRGPFPKLAVSPFEC
jgi:hypothetical protein